MMNGIPVNMDIYYPATANGLWPALIIVHGGAWITGDKETSASLAIQPGLTARGILVVSINYRLAPTFTWPAMVEDAKCAVRSLRAHARDYNVDPNRIGIEGDSVGGQIALLVGLTDPSVGWDVGPYLEYSSQVQAVVDFFGPTDLTDPSLYDLVRSKGRRAFYDLSYNSPELIKASPITYVKRDAPPIFIAHGNLDLTVRFAQSQMFYDKMKALGAPITLVEMKNGVHSFGPVYYQVTPTYDEVYAMAVDFVVSQLTSPNVMPLTTPTITPTATPPALVVEAKDISVYCRFGPSSSYSSVGFLQPGLPVGVEATVADHSWWEIRNPSNLDTDCWVANSVTRITGNPSEVPIVAAPQGNAIGVAVSLTPVIHGACDASNTNTFQGTITSNGPGTIDYHWEVDSTATGLVAYGPGGSLAFYTAGTQAVPPDSYTGSCGTFIVRLIATYPNVLQGQATYDVR
jgi:acetyl esterase/lipase